MATTGWKFPTANVQYAATTDGYTPVWASEANLYADDTSYATSNGEDCDAGPGEKVRWYTFGFTSSDIPADATIDGIEIEFAASGDSTTNSTQKHVLSLQLYNGSTLVGTEQTQEAATTLTVYTKGGASNMLGTSLTQAQITATGFGVVMWVKGNPAGIFSWSENIECTVDYVKIRVTYTEAAGDTEVLAAAEGLVITEQAATITQAFGVAAAAEGLLLTEFAATVSHDIGVSVAASSLTLSAQQATLTFDVGVSGVAEALVLTPLSAAVGLIAGVSGSVEILVLTTHAATIGQDLSIATGAPPTLTLTAHAATVEAANVVSATVGALTLTTLAAGVAHDIAVTGALEGLVLTPLAASVEQAWQVNAALEALTITEQQATITYNPEVNTVVAALTITTLPAAVYGEVVSSARLVDPIDGEASWNVVEVSPSRNLAEPTISGSNSATASPAALNEVET